MKNVLFALLILLMMASCQKDEVTTEPELNYDSLVVTASVSQIDIDRAFVALNTSISVPLLAQRTILFREYGATTFLETNNGLLIDLTRGKKHEVKTRVTIDGVSYESELISFITKGYNSGTEVMGSVLDLNRKFNLLFLDNEQELSEFAQPISAYAKIGDDSVQVELSNIGEDAFSFEFNGETQQFFENDEEYIANKAFTIGFFSGDYYQELNSPQTTINYDGELTYRWNFFNKKPRIESYVNHENSACLEADNRMGLLDLSGKFWGLVSGPSNNVGEDETHNVPDILSIRLTNIDDPSIEKVYYIQDLESLYDVYSQCDIVAFGQARDLTNGEYAGFHADNLLRLRFNKNYITAGDYRVTYAVEKDNVAFISDEFIITLE